MARGTYVKAASKNRRSEWADQAQSIVDDAIAEVEVP